MNRGKFRSHRLAWKQSSAARFRYRCEPETLPMFVHVSALWITRTQREKVAEYSVEIHPWKRVKNTKFGLKFKISTYFSSHTAHSTQHTAHSSQLAADSRTAAEGRSTGAAGGRTGQWDITRFSSMYEVKPHWKILYCNLMKRKMLNRLTIVWPTINCA